MSKARAKGTKYENLVLAYVQENGFPNATRTTFSSSLGDLEGLPFTIECKDQKTMTLPVWLTQLAHSVAKTGKLGFVVHKRARANVADSYCTIPLKDLVRIMQMIENSNP